MAWADGAFFYPTRREYDRPENHGLSCEDVFFASGHGTRLHGWFFPAPSPIGTVVHCHGNAGNVSAHFPFVAWLPACGWNVLCFDYRGYGQSAGHITRSGAVNDVEAAVRYVNTRPDVDAGRVCVVGQSIGGALAIVAAARSDLGLAGLCLEGAFASYRAEARFVTRRVWWLWTVSPLVARYLVSDDYSAIDFAPRLPAIPKLFIGGADDTIVDAEQVIALHDAATPPKELWIIPGSDHTEAITGAIPGGQQRVLAFLNSCGRVPAPAVAGGRQ